MDEDVKLSNCPFCGGSDIFVEPDERGSGDQWVSPIHVGCAQCKAEQMADDEDGAIAAWNRRAAQPVASAAPADQSAEIDALADKIVEIANGILASNVAKWPTEADWRCDTRMALDDVAHSLRALKDTPPPAPQPSAAPADRNAVLSKIEDMHERAWSRECERGNLDRAEWHRECAGQMRAMKGERP